MASSKTLLLLLCALFALVFILSSEVSTLDAKEEPNSVEESKRYGGGRGRYGGCKYGCCKYYKYKCKKCCANANEVPANANEVPDSRFVDDPKH